MSIAALTDKQKAYRKRLLARIHLAPVYVSHFKDNRGEYETMLMTAFGKKSAALLSIKQLMLLESYLYGKTRKPATKKTANVAQISANNTANHANSALVEHITPAQIKHIEGLWQRKARTPTPAALRNFIEKNFKKIVLNLGALSKKEASGLINAINRM